MEKLRAKNYIGYALCDIGGMLAFTAVGSYLSVFYTDVLKISTVAVTVIMVIARIWDGINDPMMGFIAQGKRAGKHGKYRPFILVGGILLSIASVLMFVKIPNMSVGFYTIYAALTYILYGMLYTVVLVPYGSLANVMTTKENERSILSMCRSIGGGIGSLPVAMLFPMLCFTSDVLDGGKLVLAMCVLAVIMIAMYVLSFSLTRENAAAISDDKKIKIGETIKSVLKNKAFVIMSLIGCLLMASAMYLNTVNVYIFKDYYQKSGLLTMLTVFSYLPMMLLVPFVNKLIKRFGKKEISIAGLVVACLASLLVFVLRVKSAWTYIAFSFFINAGVGFLTLEVWAMANDVIDYQELVTNTRQEAANYAIFTFMRKVGQALAALAPLLVGLVGYDNSLVGLGQNAETLEGMYTVATIVPFAIFALMLVLAIVYPLNKAKMDEIHAELDKRRAQKEGELS